MTVQKHEYLQEEDYYESRGVGTRARGDKWCAHCGQKIPKGEPHTVHSFYPEFASYPTHDRCNQDFKASLRTPADDEEELKVTTAYAKVVDDALENDELVFMVRDLGQSKLQAVKNVKDQLGIGLKQAKDIVDKIHEIYKK